LLAFRGISDLNSAMMTRALPTAFVLLGLCLPLVAQESHPGQDNEETISRDQLEITGAVDVPSALALYQPDSFTRSNNSILIYGFPALTLLDGRQFLISGPLGRLNPLDFLPVSFMSSVGVQKIDASPIYGTGAPGGIVDLRLNRNVSGGEFGVFYGKSTGKFEYEEKSAHILGSVGNDKLQITAGAFYEEASGHRPSPGH
jgi:outer membrane receptor protein involved in Fe transport